MPGRIRSRARSRSSRLRRISSLTGKTSTLAARNSPSVRILSKSWFMWKPSFEGDAFPASGYGSASGLEKRLEQIVGLLEMLRDDPGCREYRHEVYIAVPPRHHVPVHVIREPRPRASAQVRAQVEAVAVERRAQPVGRESLQLGDSGALGAIEQLGRGEMPPRRDHQVSIVVGKAVEHHQ